MESMERVVLPLYAQLMGMSGVLSSVQSRFEATTLSASAKQAKIKPNLNPNRNQISTQYNGTYLHSSIAVDMSKSEAFESPRSAPQHFPHLPPPSPPTPRQFKTAFSTKCQLSLPGLTHVVPADLKFAALPMSSASRRMQSLPQILVRPSRATHVQPLPERSFFQSDINRTPECGNCQSTVPIFLVSDHFLVFSESSLVANCDIIATPTVMQ